MADPTAKDAVRPLLRVRQVREFTDEPIAPELIDAIADAARWSGSSQNTQPWRFVIVRSADVLREIATAGKPQTRSLESATAAIAIVMPDDSGRAVSHAFDEGRAAERILAAASILGLGAGIAWIRPEARAVVTERLGLPSGRFVRTMVSLGHPTAAALRPKADRGEARLPREETVFEERWEPE